MKMSKEALNNMEAIRAIEDKYGLMPFRMGLANLIDMGISNLDKDSVDELLKEILAQGELDKANGKITIMTPELKCEILRCSAELAMFSIFTLFAYIKQYVYIEI